MDKSFKAIGRTLPYVIMLLSGMYLFKLVHMISMWINYGIKINIFLEVIYISLLIASISIAYFLRKREYHRQEALKHDAGKL